MRKPEFENYLKIMAREEPDRPTLIEYFINPDTMARFAQPPRQAPEGAGDAFGHYQLEVARVFHEMGYDFANVAASGFHYPLKNRNHEGAETISLNEGGQIVDRASFETFQWLEPEDFDCSWLGRAESRLPTGMKLIVKCPGGVLENTIALVGYEQLCVLSALEPDLVGEIFDAVGSRLVRYFEMAIGYDVVGGLLSNDDWGFKTQTMLSTDQMRRYVFPWHKKIVALAHDAGKPAALHSCGNFEAVADDIADDMQFDGRHSYEDNILPVEDAYERYHDRFAIIGGIDVDFLCRATTQKIADRCRAMLERTKGRGGYGLGSGNSLPGYVPQEAIRTMLDVALEA